MNCIAQVILHVSLFVRLFASHRPAASQLGHATRHRVEHEERVHLCSKDGVELEEWVKVEDGRVRHPVAIASSAASCVACFGEGNSGTGESGARTASIEVIVVRRDTW